MSKEKAIIILTVAIDVVGLGIIIPVMPLYVESFGLSAFYVTLLISVYSFFSFISAPFLGALSDKLGRRVVLITSIASTAFGWLLFAMARGFPMLMIGRIIDGMAAGNISTAQSVMSDVAKDPKERAGNLGLIGMIFGLGFIIGPFIGGSLSKISTSAPFYFVAGMAFLNTILAYFFLPETNKHIDKAKKISWNPTKPLVTAVQDKKLRRLYLVWFLMSTIFVVANSIFALFLSTTYGFGPFVSGFFFTGVGIILALNQGFLIKKFWLVKWKEKELIKIMLGFFAVGFLAMTIKSLPVFVFGMILTAFGQSSMGIAMTNEIIGEADAKERGEAVGVMSGINSAATIVAPLISGATFIIRPNLPYFLVSMLSIITWFIMNKIKVADNQSEVIEELAREVT